MQSSLALAWVVYSADLSSFYRLDRGVEQQFPGYRVHLTFGCTSVASPGRLKPHRLHLILETLPVHPDVDFYRGAKVWLTA